MKLRWQLDSLGEPYLVLHAEPEVSSIYSEADLLLERFIQQARLRGVIVQNESGLETDNSYASLRLRLKGEYCWDRAPREIANAAREAALRAGSEEGQ